MLRTDIIELAFYWRLLEPLRTRSSTPAGWVYLRAPDGSVVRQRVEIPRGAFDNLDRLIDQVRQARIAGVQPRFCRCPVCSRLRREQVQRRVTEVQDLSAIWGVGRCYAPLIEEFGVNNWDELTACDVTLLADHMRKAGMGVGEQVIRRWQAHAQSLKSGRPAWVDDPAPFPVGNEYIAFDLEYNAAAKDIWLIGARVVAEAGDVIFSCWTDGTGNRMAFEALLKLLECYPDLPIVTWNGRGADLPMLETATARCEMEALVETVADRHIDLFNWQRRHLMLPIMDFGLKQISEWARISRGSEVLSGLQADALHMEYMQTASSTIREKLLDYSRDDVDGLVQLCEFLRGLAASDKWPEPYRFRDAREIIDLAFEQPITPHGRTHVRSVPCARNGPTCPKKCMTS